jgi:hypothetical protein
MAVVVMQRTLYSSLAAKRCSIASPMASHRVPSGPGAEVVGAYAHRGGHIGSVGRVLKLDRTISGGKAVYLHGLGRADVAFARERLRRGGNTRT